MRAFHLWLMALAVCGLAGCAATKIAAEPGTKWMVNVSRSPIYRYGPAQSFGADFNLTKGMVVTMLKREYGYSHVMTEEGQSGFVATEDLIPAPLPTPTPEAEPSKPGKKKSAVTRRTEYDLTPQVPETDPIFIPEDSGEMPLGLPEDPEAAPVPSFRY